MIRSEEIRQGPPGKKMLPGTPRDVISEGERLLHFVATGGREFQVYHHDPEGHAPFDIGAPVALRCAEHELHLFRTSHVLSTKGFLTAGWPKLHLRWRPAWHET